MPKQLWAPPRHYQDCRLPKNRFPGGAWQSVCLPVPVAGQSASEWKHSSGWGCGPTGRVAPRGQWPGARRHAAVDCSPPAARPAPLKSRRFIGRKIAHFPLAIERLMSIWLEPKLLVPNLLIAKLFFSLSIISQIISVQPTGPKLLVHSHLVTSGWFTNYSPTW
jgi:hypothetical protein